MQRIYVVRRRTQAQQRPAEDGRGPPTLFRLCARVVSASMDRLEQDVWDLPAVMLQEILPLLSIYYLDRIEQTTVSKGLSTQSHWQKYWVDIMKGGRPDKNVKCWRIKFMESLFHNVLRGVLSVTAERLLADKRCSPLLFCSRYVKEFTITNRQQGVSLLTPEVLEQLSVSVETIKLLHLRSSDLGLESLKLVLHHLIHHGQVTKLVMLSWPAPDYNLLEMILGMSAGFWQDTGDLPCQVCSKDPPHDPSEFALEPGHRACAGYSPCTAPMSRMQFKGYGVGSQSALLSLQPLNISQNIATDIPGVGLAEVAVDPTLPLHASSSKNSPTSQDPLQSRLDSQKNDDSKQDDLYDFIFSAPKGNSNDLDINGLYEKCCSREVSDLESQPARKRVITLKDRNIRIPYLEGARYLRSIRTLNLHNITLSQASCLTMCHLLQSWDSLERLTLAYNDVGGNIPLFLDALSILSHRPTCSLQALSLSDFTAYIPTIHLAHIILSTFPALQTLSLSYDMEDSSSSDLFVESPTEFNENHLKQLDLRFPQDTLHCERLVALLEASTSLLELSLDNSSFPDQEIMKAVLRTITERHSELKKLCLHDVKLVDVQHELLLFLQKAKIEDVRFSFCRLFERVSVDFFAQFVAALKKNQFMKILKLCGNRLGNDGLVAMADIYAPDSASQIQHLDISSNCIKPDGLIQFAKKLENYGSRTLKHLSIAQNLLDRDPVTAQEALRRIGALLCAVSDRWDTNQTLVGQLSIMRALFPNFD